MDSRRQCLALAGRVLAASARGNRAQDSGPFRLGLLLPLTGAGSTYRPGVLKTMSPQRKRSTSLAV